MKLRVNCSHIIATAASPLKPLPSRQLLFVSAKSKHQLQTGRAGQDRKLTLQLDHSRPIITQSGHPRPTRCVSEHRHHKF
eukprot:6208777-Pleurochrysis_carterae.AAC.7